MRSYTSTSGKESGVIGFELGEDFIVIRFTDYTTYKYTYSSCGPHAVQEMKILAMKSKGLSTYVAQNDPPFESKI